MGEAAEAALERLRSYRTGDAPTHGGHVLSYVYDPGSAELDELAARAIRIMQPVNGLDPTTFGSVAAIERDLVRFARDLLGGDEEVVGTITSGGTESCLPAVKTARDLWRAAGGTGTPRLLAPVTVHAAFHKAASYFGLELDLVPVDPLTGAPTADAVIARLGSDVALAVVSAPSYPFATLDPVRPVAAACADAGVPLHVDACIGGLVLPFAEGLPDWDLRVPGVTSLSADLHKYGYAPKGVSVLLHRGADRLRAQYFATTRWPGYPVVNPTMLGSRSAGPAAAAWAIVQALGVDGLGALARTALEATRSLVDTVTEIEGLRVVGTPAGPLFAVAADDSAHPDARVDPHHWADALRGLGWQLQLQPGLVQEDGVRLPHTTHLTVTPVTAQVLPELQDALRAGADLVRGIPQVAPMEAIAALGGDVTAVLDGPLPESLAPLLALVEGLPPERTEQLLIELLARLIEP
nr:aspartate aminotransferase family protein [Naasia aerilata]